MTGPQRGKNCLCERRPSAGRHCPPAAPRRHELPHTHPAGTPPSFFLLSLNIISLLLLLLFSASECSYIPGNAADARTALLFLLRKKGLLGHPPALCTRIERSALTRLSEVPFLQLLNKGRLKTPPSATAVSLSG